MPAKIDTRCLECCSEFPTETLVLSESGWSCPKCGSVNVERIMPNKGYKYDAVKIKYMEGNHD